MALASRIRTHSAKGSVKLAVGSRRAIVASVQARLDITGLGFGYHWSHEHSGLGHAFVVIIVKKAVLTSISPRATMPATPDSSLRLKWRRQ